MKFAWGLYGLKKKKKKPFFFFLSRQFSTEALTLLFRLYFLFQQEGGFWRIDSLTWGLRSFVKDPFGAYTCLYLFI